MSATNYDCPACGGQLRPTGLSRVFQCRSCGRVIEETGAAEPPAGA